MPDPVFLEMQLLIERALRRVSWFYCRKFSASRLMIGSVAAVDVTVFLLEPYLVVI